jgi:hypothetical protein
MSERPDGAALLDEVVAFVRRFLVLPADRYFDVIALWVLHAHSIAGADSSPRLLLKSAEKQSGKSRTLELLEMLTPNPLLVLNASVAALFRLIAQEQCTILFDEVDTLFAVKVAPQHEDLKAMLNAGHHRGTWIPRVDVTGKKMVVKKFPVFAATALASIGDVPDTIADRAITIPMRRRAPDEPVEQFRRRWAERESSSLRDSLAEWAQLYVPELADADPKMPDGVVDRAADCWMPLLAIADLAGGDWPARAREAATAIVSGRVAEDQSLGVRLLADIRVVLDGEDRMSSAALASALNSLEESGWGNWNDRHGIGQRDLAARLKHYFIQPKTVRLPDGSTPRGYKREDFFDAWSRYLRDVHPNAKPKSPSQAAPALDEDFDFSTPKEAT